MFSKKDILYEDNHLLAVNKRIGESVQSDNTEGTALEDEIKEYIRVRDAKKGNVFLGVIHRIDKPVSGVVLFAKSAKALRRLNEAVKEREVKKNYWAIVCEKPKDESGEMVHHIVRDGQKNRSFAYDRERSGSKEARLAYRFVGASQNYYLLEIDLITGRHHQIRAQLAKEGMPIKGDLKYGAPRSNKGGGISLHARSVGLIHPVTKEKLVITAPVPPEDNLWRHFEGCLS